MKVANRKGIRFSLVAGLAATGLVGVTSLTASGQPATQSAGTIVVDAVAPPDGTGKLLATVEYRDAAGSLVDTQTISANGPCDTLIDEGPRFLSIGTTPPNSRPVLVNDGLGILSGNQNCGAEGVIDETESLNLALGAFFDNTALFDTDVYVSATTLEVLRSGSPARLAVTRDTNATEERTVTAGIVDAETFGRWDESLAVSSTANRFNRGIVLVNATFTLERTVANQAPTASFTANVQAAPNVRTVDFDETSSDPDGTVVTWEWNFGDNNTKTINRVPGSVESGDTSHTYAADDSYPVTLTVTDNLGRTFTTTSQNVTIVNQAPTASFTWDATTLTVDFTDASSDPDGTVEAWAWTFGDPNSETDISTDQNPVYTYSQNGTYPVTLTVTDNLGRTSTAFTDTVTVTGTAVFCSREVTGSGTAATATFLRGENGDKFTDPCADVGVVVEVGNDPVLGDYVFWDNSFKGVDGTDQDVNGLVTINWAPINPADPAAVARLNTGLIDYDGFADGIGPRPQSYCLSFSRSDMTGPDGTTVYEFVVELPDWPWFLEDGTPEPGFILVDGARKVPWCLVSDTREVLADGTIVQTEELFGRGDPIRYK